MCTRYIKRYWRVGLYLAFLCFVIGCSRTLNILSTRDTTEKFPIRTLSIRFDEDEPEELISQLRKFSEKNGLKFHVSFYKNKEVFYIDISGQGLEILALSKTINKTELDIHFYVADPNTPPSKEIVDSLFNDLKMFINEVPNAEITEEN